VSRSCDWRRGGCCSGSSKWCASISIQTWRFKGCTSWIDWKKNNIKWNNPSPCRDSIYWVKRTTHHTQWLVFSTNVGNKCAVSEIVQYNNIPIPIHKYYWRCKKNITLTLFNFHCSVYMKQKPKHLSSISLYYLQYCFVFQWIKT